LRKKLAAVPPQRRKDAEKSAENDKRDKNSAEEWSGMVVFPAGEEAENAEPSSAGVSGKGRVENLSCGAGFAAGPKRRPEAHGTLAS